jgi:hypothetical protein
MRLELDGGEPVDFVLKKLDKLESCQREGAEERRRDSQQEWQKA